MTNGTIHIDPLSCCSLRLPVLANGTELSRATGFVVEHGGDDFLITNGHVVTGRNPDTGELLSPTGAEPDELQIIHHVDGQLGTWKVDAQPLYSPAGDPLWWEHPEGRNVDVVALPLDMNFPDLTTYPLDLSLADHNVALAPAMAVSIIGYPFGLATGQAFPIWKTGHIASDPGVNYDGRPAFLIDATTRGGMSGSPVVFRSSGPYPSRDGALKLGGTVTAFLGVYSGRIHEDAEVGLVWRPRLVTEILEVGIP